jgi:hypothetical protein
MVNGNQQDEEHPAISGQSGAKARICRSRRLCGNVRSVILESWRKWAGAGWGSCVAFTRAWAEASFERIRMTLAWANSW